MVCRRYHNFTSLPFQQCKHHISTVDCQPSDPASDMLVFVSGNLQLAGEQHALKFSQMFHLMPTPQGSFYVCSMIYSAICGNDALRELSSPGKSGSFFNSTQDDRFMVTKVKKSEVKVLLRMLPSYYKLLYLSRCFYGCFQVTTNLLHCIKPVGGQKTRFIVMGKWRKTILEVDRSFLWAETSDEDPWANN